MLNVQYDSRKYSSSWLHQGMSMNMQITTYGGANLRLADLQ